MLELLAKAIIGVATFGLIGGGAYVVYKIITKELAKREISSIIQDDDAFKEAFKAKYTQKKEEAFTFTVMDEWDEPLGDVDLTGDEISSDIKIGDEIIL